jgi:hypothetical protein
LKSPAVPSLRGKQRRILHGGPDYFATLGVRRVALRDLGEENSTATEVGVVNEEFARRFFQGTNPVGHMVTGAGVPYQIVGVVKDTKRARSIKTSALSSTAPSTSSSTSLPRRMATPSWLDLRPGSGLERAGQERKFFLTDSDLVQDAPLKRGQGCETNGFNH